MAWQIDHSQCGVQLTMDARSAARCKDLSEHSSALSNPTGMTLVELLVVIGMIGVLAGMLFPMLSLAREHAHRSDCIANLRQLVVSVQMYESDYQALPISSGSPELLDGKLWAYGATVELGRCPSDRGAPPETQARGPLRWGQTSYLYLPTRGYLEEYGIGQPLRLEPCSPLFVCFEHADRAPRRLVVGRYDGSVSTEPREPLPTLELLGRR